jgi:3-hydroxyisobutyrate dehydrogenase-like beta-hydroxyacid dehydrogenase
MSNHNGPVGVIGLGNMGMPMSVNMMKDGFRVIGTAKTRETKDAFAAAGGEVAETSRDIAETCTEVITALPSAAAFESVMDTIIKYGNPGMIVLETSTLPISVKENAKERLAAKSITLLDAPLSGTGAQAKQKDIIVFCSGDAEAYEKFLPIMKGFSKAQYNLGAFGNGMKMKLIANQLVAIHNLSSAEAVLFCEKMGFDPHLMIDVVKGGAGGSRMLEIRGPVMADRSWADTQISNEVFQKDIVLIDQALAEAGCPSPLFMAAKPIYTAALASGHAEYDTSSIFDILDKMSK